MSDNYPTRDESGHELGGKRCFCNVNPERKEGQHYGNRRVDMAIVRLTINGVHQITEYYYDTKLDSYVAYPAERNNFTCESEQGAYDFAAYAVSLQ